MLTPDRPEGTKDPKESRKRGSPLRIWEGWLVTCRAEQNIQHHSTKLVGVLRSSSTQFFDQTSIISIGAKTRQKMKNKGPLVESSF